MSANLQHEWSLVGDRLRDYTYIFYKIWELGTPVFSKKFPTAWVEFDSNGNNIGFCFNPAFWNRLNTYQRSFIVAHECLHILLNHGVRGKSAKFRDLSNIAMDVVVNTMLVDNYGFDRSKLGDFSTEGCWLDTVFEKKNITVSYGENYEYYYNLLEENTTFIEVDTLELCDDHSGLGKILGEGIASSLPLDIQQDADDIKNQDKEGDKVDCGHKAGTETGHKVTVALEESKISTAWTDLFKHFVKIKSPRLDENEQWARLHRRLQSMDSRLMIPSEHYDFDVEKPEKISIWLFIDVSGSCENIRPYFFKAVKSIPTDKFDIRLFTFDTEVHEIKQFTKKRERIDIWGCGGTSFTTIEANIQTLIRKEHIKYPTLVLIFTDGEGDYVYPEYPDRWHWFLHTDSRFGYFAKDFIPKKSYSYKLVDFV